MVSSTRLREAAPPSDESARIRLEGAYEVLQAALGRYRQAAKVLSGSGWRKALLQEPDLLDELRRGEPALAGACEKARALASREPGGAAGELLERVGSSRAEVHRLVQAKLRARAPIGFEAAVEQLSARVMTEVPGDLQPGERRVLEGGSDRRVWLAAGAFAFALAQLIGPIMAASQGSEKIALLLLAAVLLAGLAIPVVMQLLSGSYVLTNRRLIWRPTRGQAVQVPLSGLKPGSMRLSRPLSWIHVDALEPFTMRGVQHARVLAAKAETLRWLAAAGSKSAEPLTEVAIFPALKGAEGPDSTLMPLTGTAVMRPGFAAFFPEGSAGAALEAITGNTPGTSVDLEAAFKLMRELPEAEFDRAIRAAATRVGGLFERPASLVASPGPVWQLLVVADGAQAFSAKIDWRYLAETEAMVARWRAG